MTLTSRLLFLLPAALAAGASGEQAPAQTSPPAPAALNDRLAGDIGGVHDPAIIRQGDTYYLFTTSQERENRGLIHIRTSKDLVTWTRAPSVFAEIPAWARAAVPGTVGIWAPDVYRARGEYRVYYSISTFGKNGSAIGLVTTPSLEKPAWTDKGLVIASTSESDFNAIDPNIVEDGRGGMWMSFGSFWTGIKMIAIDPATGMRKGNAIHAIASRPQAKPLADAPVSAGANAVEAPFIIRRDKHFYQFVSYDYCCRGPNSSYYTVVGRSRHVTGPYVDREGKPLMQGGGTIVLHASQDASKRFVGPGHVSILREPKRDYIVYHAYDTQVRGRPTLRIRPLSWTRDGWPVAE
jgi:arabinan endo-1,5-alpha-L-arabinosidase